MILQLCAQPLAPSVLAFPWGHVSFREDDRAVSVEARESGVEGETLRWARRIDVSAGNCAIMPRGCSTAVADACVLVFTFGEHERGATWHNFRLACFDLERGFRWDIDAEFGRSMALRDGILYAVSREESALPRGPARLRLRAFDFRTGAEILDEDVFSPMAQKGLPTFAFLDECRFVERNGLHLELPPLGIRVP